MEFIVHVKSKGHDGAVSVLFPTSVFPGFETIFNAVLSCFYQKNAHAIITVDQCVPWDQMKPQKHCRYLCYYDLTEVEIRYSQTPKRNLMYLRTLGNILNFVSSERIYFGYSPQAAGIYFCPSPNQA
jgi:hypothetical protein